MPEVPPPLLPDELPELPPEVPPMPPLLPGMLPDVPPEELPEVPPMLPREVPPAPLLLPDMPPELAEPSVDPLEPLERAERRFWSLDLLESLLMLEPASRPPLFMLGLSDCERRELLPVLPVVFGGFMLSGAELGELPRCAFVPPGVEGVDGEVCAPAMPITATADAATRVLLSVDSLFIR